MFRFSVIAFLFSALTFFSVSTLAQSSDDDRVIHIQTWKLKSSLSGDDATAFNEMLQRQIDAVSGDSRLISFRAARHGWGADSRDLLLISEFNNNEDLFSFYEDFNAILEAAISKEQLDKDNALFDKYVGWHADEIYGVIAETK